MQYYMLLVHCRHVESLTGPFIYKGFISQFAPSLTNLRQIWNFSCLVWTCDPYDTALHTRLSPCRYRKVVSNNCTDGVREQYTAKPQQCPGKAPRGLRIITSDGKLTAEQGHNVTLVVQLEEVQSIFMWPPWAYFSLNHARGSLQSS